MSKPVLFLLLGAILGILTPGLPFAPLIGAILGAAFGSVYSLCEWGFVNKRVKPCLRTPSNNHKHTPAADGGQPAAFVTQSIEWEFEPEELAPPVDEELLMRYCEGKLSKEEAKEVVRFLTDFRSWDDAMNRVIGQLRRQHHPAESLDADSS